MQAGSRRLRRKAWQNKLGVFFCSCGCVWFFLCVFLVFLWDVVLSCWVPCWSFSDTRRFWRFSKHRPAQYAQQTLGGEEQSGSRMIDFVQSFRNKFFFFATDADPLRAWSRNIHLVEGSCERCADFPAGTCSCNPLDDPKVQSREGQCLSSGSASSWKTNNTGTT